jgi:hypothetical protein
MTCSTCDKYDKWVKRLGVPVVLTQEEISELLLFLRDERDAHGDRDSAAIFR